ncbi:MAG: bifunctional glutamate N-acetyltransferase/amino-acid acetyltransferase ArgJ [Candidatus Diapherotrites archaeon]
MKLARGGITFPKGFYAIGKKAGIKARKKDLCVIYSDNLANAAGCFTTNTVKAPPVIVSIGKLKNGKAQAVVVNSGCANACTGKRGLKDAEKTVELTAKELGVEQENVVVASTGLIGSYLPMDKVKRALTGIQKQLGRSEFHSRSAADSIMTTDTKRKEIALNVNGIRFGAMAKGSGMIKPDMATMLCFITTDAVAPAKICGKALKVAVAKTFNMVSVDGDMSTNDAVVLLANGASGRALPEKKFRQAIEFICENMAKKIAADGEGATKIMEVNVINAKSEKSAKELALAVVDSSLVKSALFGEDPNWGRIMSSIGSTKESFDPNKVDIFFGKVAAVKKGVEAKSSKKNLERALTGKEIKITINLNNGTKQAKAWGCDLTYKYVEINADYHT